MITGYADHKIDARGARFHWLEWGDVSAPPMVLLHGLTGHAHIWDHMARELTRSFHLLAPDQRGHGDSGHTAMYSTQDFVDDLEALRIEWGLERFVLMGLSMGGHNAMAYAWAYPERVSRLIVIDIPPHLPPVQEWPSWPELEKQARVGHTAFPTLDAAVEASRSGNPTAPEENLRYRTQWNVRETDAGFVLKWDPKVQVTWQPEDLSQKLREIHTPTLLIRGGRTDTLSESAAAKMIEAFPDADFAEIATSGHSVPTDRPEELTPVVLEWLVRRKEASLRLVRRSQLS